MLSLLQQSKSSGNISNQVFIIPSNMTTKSGEKFHSSFSFWILDSGATDYICSSLTHFTSYHQINPIYVKLPNANQVIANYYGIVDGRRPNSGPSLGLTTRSMVRNIQED